MVYCKAHFHLSRYVDKQNYGIWGTENPRKANARTVWCGFWAGGVIGPYFIEDKNSRALTVNGERYRVYRVFLKCVRFKVFNLNFDFCAMAYTNIEYADIVFMLGLADGNGNLAARLWAERFPQRRVPRPNTFLTTYRRLRETGNVRPVNEVGRPRFVRNVANEELVLDLVHEDPELSYEEYYTKIICTPRQRVQELLPRDYPARLIFSQTIIGKIAMNPIFLKNILFTDEAVFTKDGIFNQHNLHLWSEENPHAIRIRGSQYKFSINIWCGLVGNTLLGPHELPARLNGQGFLYFIMHHLPILLENVPLEEQETMWFMLDGAPPHHTNAVR
ncbi:hypothetical protein QTP88_019144 [Uroleucon formosanum]